MPNSPLWILLGLCALAQLPGGLSQALPRAFPLGTQLYWVPRGEAHPYKAVNFRLKHLEKASKGGGKMSRVTRQAPALHQPVKRATSVQVFTRWAFHHLQCVKDDCKHLNGNFWEIKSNVARREKISEWFQSEHLSPASTPSCQIFCGLQVFKHSTA